MRSISKPLKVCQYFYQLLQSFNFNFISHIDENTPVIIAVAVDVDAVNACNFDNVDVDDDADDEYDYDVCLIMMNLQRFFSVAIAAAVAAAVAVVYNRCCFFSFFFCISILLTHQTHPFVNFI